MYITLQMISPGKVFWQREGALLYRAPRMLYSCACIYSVHCASVPQFLKMDESVPDFILNNELRIRKRRNTFRCCCGHTESACPCAVWRHVPQRRNVWHRPADARAKFSHSPWKMLEII